MEGPSRDSQIKNSTGGLHPTQVEARYMADVQRSILSQLDFTHTIRKYDAEGVPFRSHLHVPETHPITGRPFLEREDPGHVLKVRVVCDLDALTHAFMIG